MPRYTEKGKSSFGFYFVIFQNPEMKRPLITTNKYPLEATIEMQAKIKEFKRAILDKKLLNE